MRLLARPRPAPIDTGLASGPTDSARPDELDCDTETLISVSFETKSATVARSEINKG